MNILKPKTVADVLRPIMKALDKLEAVAEAQETVRKTKLEEAQEASAQASVAGVEAHRARILKAKLAELVDV